MSHSIALSCLLLFAVGLGPAQAAAHAFRADGYTTNAICTQQNCVNPIFPGLLDLTELQARSWQCQSNAAVKQYMKFCTEHVNYDVAINSPNSTATLESLVQAQDNAAVTIYFYHLAALNMDAWEHRGDLSASPCAKATREMVCHTYFPKAQAGCKVGEATPFLRPCKDVCLSYVQACDVRCCDESVQCVFNRTLLRSDGSSTALVGYADASGPSAVCTGGTSSAASRGAATWPLWALVPLVLSSLVGRNTPSTAAAPTTARAKSAFLPLALVGLSGTLQGCGVITGAHTAKAWEEKPSYFTDFEFVPPGKPVNEAALNSCEVQDIQEKERCNGNGVCREFKGDRNDNANADALAVHGSVPRIRFCLCNRDWADPECRTRRKSQTTAFLLSLFMGYAGVDRFYIGELYTGTAKLSTLGGLGAWWFFDIVRIGASPVYANNYRLANDLPHTTFVVVTTLFAVCLALLAYGVFSSKARKKKQTAQLLMSEDEFMRTTSATLEIIPEGTVGQPVRSSYGMPRPVFFGYGATAGDDKAAARKATTRAAPAACGEGLLQPTAAPAAPTGPQHRFGASKSDPVPTPPFVTEECVVSAPLSGP